MANMDLYDYNKQRKSRFMTKKEEKDYNKRKRERLKYANKV